MTEFTFKSIGKIKTPYREKFCIPRQAGLVPNVKGTIELEREFSSPRITAGLEGFSHIWILFVFHKNLNKNWMPTVRPPRLGGNKKKGVFASRSPFRPNLIGMSILELDSIEEKNGKVYLHVNSPDMMDGTPILDIKPYIPDNDIKKNARHGWLDNAPTDSKFPVTFSQRALDFLKKEKREMLKDQIEAILCLDPRPPYYRMNPKDRPKEDFAFGFDDFDIHFKMVDGVFLVTWIEFLAEKS